MPKTMSIPRTSRLVLAILELGQLPSLASDRPCFALGADSPPAVIIKHAGKSYDLTVDPASDNGLKMKEGIYQLTGVPLDR